MQHRYESGDRHLRLKPQRDIDDDRNEKDNEGESRLGRYLAAPRRTDSRYRNLIRFLTNQLRQCVCHRVFGRCQIPR